MLQVRDVVGLLVEVLTTPSAEVQRAVASCLPALMPGLVPDRPYLEALITTLLDRLLRGKTYGDRCNPSLAGPILRGMRPPWQYFYSSSAFFKAVICDALRFTVDNILRSGGVSARGNIAET